ncbi:MAG: type II toxin-antitoxin system HigB family toxin [Bacteroidia bacterium]|nr:type II toxin-antitoxin system HigB family toxin [Bacteroidia bacterium]
MENYLQRKVQLIHFWKKQAQKESVIKGFIHTVESLHWKSINKIKDDFPTVSILKNNRLVFNLKGNQYRLIVSVRFLQERCYLAAEWMGTHAEYTNICKANLQYTITNYTDHSTHLLWPPRSNTALSTLQNSIQRMEKYWKNCFPIALRTRRSFLKLNYLHSC